MLVFSEFPMPDYTMSMLYLGNLAELDTVDGDGTAENQSALLGTYYGAADPAADHIIDVTATDANADGAIQSNDTAGTETVTYDLGSGPVTTQYDAVFNSTVTVAFGTGSGAPDYNGAGGILQTETGDVFMVMIDDDYGMGANDLDNYPIKSITINSISSFGTDQAAQASDDQSFVPCFTAGTGIRTARGEIPVEQLRPDDWVETLDNGLRPVVWIGRNRLGPAQLAAAPHLNPVYIAAGALGDGYPVRDLILSPQHRILLRSAVAQRMFGEKEVMVPCLRACGLPGIQQFSPRLGVHYYHFLCEDHQLVWAQGAPSESLYLGPQSLRGLGEAARRELSELLPGALSAARARRVRPARFLPAKGKQIARLMQRHGWNDRPLLEI